MDEINIILVRHVESMANEAGIILGQNENDKKHLSLKGIKQAKELGYKINKVVPNIDAIYSSELSRAYETAQIIAESVNKKITVHRYNGLNEMSLGVAEETSINEFKERYPIEAKTWINLGYPTQIKGQENPKNLSERMKNAIQEIAKKEQGKKVICIVSHQLAITCLLLSILNVNKISSEIGNGEYIHLTYNYSLSELKVK